MSFSRDGYVLMPGEGDALWFLDTLVTIKAGGEQTDGAFTVLEQRAPGGFGPPPHVHHHEDEAFYVLEGSLRVTCGDRSWTAGSGAFIFLPRGIVHRFEVTEAAPARLLQITSPAGFERFAGEIGSPAQSLELPLPSAPDIPRLLESARRHGYEIVGPER
ncbi:MAG: quercetin 2,3-dioxygenase [Chloroflexota bacterium]